MMCVALKCLRFEVFLKVGVLSMHQEYCLSLYKDLQSTSMMLTRPLGIPCHRNWVSPIRHGHCKFDGAHGLEVVLGSIAES